MIQIYKINISKFIIWINYFCKKNTRTGHTLPILITSSIAIHFRRLSLESKEYTVTRVQQIAVMIISVTIEQLNLTIKCIDLTTELSNSVIDSRAKLWNEIVNIRIAFIVCKE